MEVHPTSTSTSSHTPISDEVDLICREKIDLSSLSPMFQPRILPSRTKKRFIPSILARKRRRSKCDTVESANKYSSNTFHLDSYQSQTCSTQNFSAQSISKSSLDSATPILSDECSSLKENLKRHGHTNEDVPTTDIALGGTLRERRKINVAPLKNLNSSQSSVGHKLTLSDKVEMGLCAYQTHICPICSGPVSENAMEYFAQKIEQRLLCTPKEQRPEGLAFDLPEFLYCFVVGSNHSCRVRVIMPPEIKTRVYLYNMWGLLFRACRTADLYTLYFNIALHEPVSLLDFGLVAELRVHRRNIVNILSSTTILEKTKNAHVKEDTTREIPCVYRDEHNGEVLISTSSSFGDSHQLLCTMATLLNNEILDRRGRSMTPKRYYCRATGGHVTAPQIQYFFE